MSGVFIGEYRVTDSGRVFRGDKMLREFKHASGFNRVHLKVKGSIKQPFVHTLVAEAFIPNPNGYKYIIHKNGDRADCRVNNLLWSSKPHQYVCKNHLTRSVILTKGEENLEFNSIKDAADFLGASSRQVSNVGLGRGKTVKGYSVKHKN